MIKAIPDTHHSIDRVVIKGILCDLVEVGMLPPYLKYDYQPYLKSHNTSKDSSTLVWKADRYLKVSGSFQPTDGMDAGAPMIASKFMANPIFLDAVTKVALQPIYKNYRVELDLSFQSSSLELLEEWKQQVATMKMAGRDRSFHTPQYNYRLHKDIYALLSNIHECMENKAGYGEDFPAYIHKHMINSAKVVSSSSWKGLVITESLKDVMGFMEDISIDSDEEGRHIGTCKYYFYIKLPRSMQAIYPVQVHQTVLKRNFLPIWDTIGDSKGTSRDFDLLPHEQKIGYEEINLNSFDNTTVSSPPTGYGIVWRALLSLETGSAGEILVNLYDIPNFCLPDWLMCILKNFYEESTKPFVSPVLFSLHRGTDLMDKEYLKLDENMNLITTKPLNLRDMWHISMDIIIENITSNALYKTSVCTTCPDSIKPLEDVIEALRGINQDISFTRVDVPNFCARGTAHVYTVQSVMIETFRYDKSNAIDLRRC